MRRFLTAALLIPLVIALVLWGPPTLLGSVVVALTAVALWEYFRLAEAAGMKALPVPGYAFGLAVVLLILTDSPPVVILAAAVFFLMLLWVAAMSPSRQLAACLGSVSATFLGVVYVAVPLGLLAWICLRRDGPGSFLILFMLAVIWAGGRGGLLCRKRVGTPQVFAAHQPGQVLGRHGGIAGGGVAHRISVRPLSLGRREVWGASPAGGGSQRRRTVGRLGGVGTEKGCGREGFLTTCTRPRWSAGPH